MEAPTIYDSSPVPLRAGAHPARAGFEFRSLDERYVAMRALASLAIATLEEPFPAFARDLRHALAEIDGRAVAR